MPARTPDGGGTAGARESAPVVPLVELAARGLGHQFNPNWWCLKDVELAFRPGELVGLVGQNGAGKSTLLRALAGQLSPTAGQVTLDGKPLARLARREVARRIAFLPQDVQSSFEFTCEEVVAQGRYPHLGALGVLGPRDLEVVRRAMQWTHTEAFAHRPLAHLSGGERQRVLLASVLAQQSQFLLLDEPTAALDLHHQVDVFERIARLRREGLGIILVTHDLNLAAQYCTRLVAIHEGRVVAAGPPETVMTEATLTHVYETPLVVDRNPVTGSPMVVIGRRGAAAEDDVHAPPSPEVD